MDKTQKAGILLAVILGLPVLLYLAGLFAQLLSNYEAWLAADGITGAATMPPLNASPLFCVSQAFTATGLKGLFFLLLACGGGTAYLLLRDRVGGKEYDPRNFRYSKEGTYGTSGWMTPKELRSVLALTPPGKAEGAILGCQGGNVIWLPRSSRLNRHIAIFGSSGTGKSRSVIRNLLLQSVKCGESFFCTDPKSELYSDLSEYCRDCGYDVKVFNLVDMAHSDSWNPMAGLNGDTVMAQVLTDVMISNTSEGRGDHFWDAGEGNLLKALILYVDQCDLYGPERKNLAEVYRMLVHTDERRLNDIFERLGVDHPAKAPYNLYRQASDTVRAGILLGLGTRLQVLQNQAVGRVTSYSDIDLTAPGRQKCAYFVILSDQDSTFDFLSSLFFSVLFIQLVRFADTQPGGRCPVPVNLCLDEFNNIGTLCGGGDGKEVARKISTIRSRDIRFIFAVQSLAQLQNRYPNSVWAEILGNCDTQLMLGCTDELTAEMASTRSGVVSVVVNSTMTTKKTMAVAQMIPLYRANEGLGKRMLLTPDEVLRMPHDELLIMLRGQKVLKASKFDYSRHPDYPKLRSCSILDYQPEHHEYAPEVVPAPASIQDQPPPKKRKPTLLETHAVQAPPTNF